MDWQPLSQIVREYRDHARKAGLLQALREEVTLPQAGAALALAEAKRRGIAPVDALELSNIAALALSLEQLVAHRLRPEVPELVDETDLHVLPDEPPRLLRRAWIVEVAHPERGERLFGDVASLGGYPHQGRVGLIGLGYPDGCRVAWWRPTWTGETIESGIVRQHEPLIGDVEAHHEWVRDAGRFAVVLGLLLDAAGTPVRITDESSRPPAQGKPSKKTKPPPAWVTRYVSLSPAPWGVQDSVTAGSEGGGVEGRLAEVRPVRGHLKRQHFGPGGKGIRWIFVQAHEARRWIAPAPRRVVVGL